jgi:hypothetical protein
MRRIRFVVFAAMTLLACGCVEGEVFYTLNPDGSGKAQIDVIMAPSVFGVMQEDSPDDMARKLTGHELTKARGVTGWSNVSGEFMKDGRFHFRATAYFKRLEDVKVESLVELRLVRADDGSMTLLPEEKKERPGKKKGPPPDFAKMTDAEWEQFLLKQRIQAQSAKSLLISFLTDAKVKTTFRMPGEITEIKTCKQSGKSDAILEIDGNAVIKEFRQILSLPDMELRKLYQEGKAPSFDEDSSFDSFVLGGQPSVKVAKPGGPAFDYEKEVAAAVAGNPELRKKFAIPDFQKLPGEPGTKSKFKD